jgi:hypothetical protein
MAKTSTAIDALARQQADLLAQQAELLTQQMELTVLVVELTERITEFTRATYLILAERYPKQAEAAGVTPEGDTT